MSREITAETVQAERDFAAIVAIARRHARGGHGMTAAEMDCSLSVPGGDGHALAAIQDAMTDLAIERAGGDLAHPWGGLPLAELRERTAAMRTRVQPHLDAMIAAAKTKSYVGWSAASRGPVRYADA